jgi:hypothetical protein
MVVERHGGKVPGDTAALWDFFVESPISDYVCCWNVTFPQCIRHIRVCSNVAVKNVHVRCKFSLCCSRAASCSWAVAIKAMFDSPRKMECSVVQVSG